MPQGSVLGPVLFIIYNDICEITGSVKDVISKLFAEDVKYYKC